MKLHSFMLWQSVMMPSQKFTKVAWLWGLLQVSFFLLSFTIIFIPYSIPYATKVFCQEVPSFFTWLHSCSLLCCYHKACFYFPTKLPFELYSAPTLLTTFSPSSIIISLYEHPSSPSMPRGASRNGRFFWDHEGDLSWVVISQQNGWYSFTLLPTA